MSKEIFIMSVITLIGVLAAIAWGRFLGKFAPKRSEPHFHKWLEIDEIKLPHESSKNYEVTRALQVCSCRAFRVVRRTRYYNRYGAQHVEQIIKEDKL